MATFSKKIFNVASYSAIRPTYPRSIFDFVYQYHRRTPGVQWQRAIDLGCGTGQATVELTAFQEVIGVDPSEAMVKKADQLLDSSTIPNKIRFVQHQAEQLEFLESESVDLIVAAQAAHWFNYEILWPQLVRILRKNGTVAFWGYSQFRILGHPYLTPLIHEYSKGSNPDDSIGPYWEEPGRSILDNHFLDIPKAPEQHFKDHEHIFWTGNYYPSLPSPRPILLRKLVTWDGLQAYLRTFSSLYAYQDSHPDDSELRTGLPNRPDSGKGGDIVERFWWKLQERVSEETGEPATDEIEIEWPLTMILFKKS